MPIIYNHSDVNYAAINKSIQGAKIWDSNAASFKYKSHNYFHEQAVDKE
jgi:hypothetical protein